LIWEAHSRQTWYANANHHHHHHHHHLIQIAWILMRNWWVFLLVSRAWIFTTKEYTVFLRRLGNSCFNDLSSLSQGRSTQVGIWAADQFFLIFRIKMSIFPYILNPVWAAQKDL
jgi:hypothetical protein